jgi:hypothetical protein
MRRTLTLLSLGVATALAPPPTASAQWTVSTSTCGGNAYLSCATWSLLVSGTSYTLEVTNTSGSAPANNPNSAFTDIYLGTTGTNTFGEITNFTSSLDGWELGSTDTGNPFSGQGLLEIVFAASTENGINDALLAGETITFTWTMTGTGDINQLAIHDQGGLTEACGSNKVVYTRGAGGGTTANQPTSAQIANCNGGPPPPPPPPPVVPEPSTVVLLGTGLVGIFAASIRRRVKKD